VGEEDGDIMPRTHVLTDAERGGLMGYHYYVDACEFGINKKHFDQIWRDDAHHGKFKDSANRQKFIEFIFGENGFDCDFHADGSLAAIDQTFEKLRDQGEFFESIGAYVTPGSYILCRGEDGCIWRWRFDGACKAEDADIVFQTGSNDCPIREVLGKEKGCVECPFGLICLCETNPRLRSARCGDCDGEIIVDNLNDKVIAGTTCRCQKRVFLIREYEKGSS
jgi:hypothetical protein